MSCRIVWKRILVYSLLEKETRCHGSMLFLLMFLGLFSFRPSSLPTLYGKCKVFVLRGNECLECIRYRIFFLELEKSYGKTPRFNS